MSAGRNLWRTAPKFASTLAMVALTVTALDVYAHSTVPTLIAPRYFVGDPLFDFEGPNGELLSGLPDDPNGMASTTKIVSLHVAVDALMGRIPGACPSSPAGFCTLGDWVTISANAVAKSPWVPCGSLMGGCSSLMGDRFGEFLVVDANQNGVYDQGETVLLPSGNGTPAPGAPLTDDPHVTYVDSNNNGVRDSGEWIVYDANSNGQYDSGERTFLGPPNKQPPTNPITFLTDDPTLRFVDFYDVGTWNSYIPLQVGEKVQFQDLLRGMMYPSGNDAAIAVAEHVAGSVSTFVELMNDVTLPGHVTAAGLSNSHFTNPAGIDNWCPSVDAYGTVLNLDQSFCNDSFRKNGFTHYTTARDLARLWEHGFQDLLFRQIVGFPGPAYSFSTNFGDTQKQYRFGWGTNGYPGWDGGKGGSSTACGSGTGSPYNLNCSIMSTKRIGRRLVIGLIGASYPPTQDDPTLALDYSFSQLFHPDPRGSNESGISWIDKALTCLPDGRAVTAAMASNYGVTMTTWGVNVDGSTITKLAVSAPQGATQSVLPLAADLKATRLGGSSIVTAKTLAVPSLLAAVRGGSVKLTLWNIAQDGTPSVVADAPAGAGADVNLLPINASQFLSAFVGQDGTLVLKAWKVGAALSPKGTTLVNFGSLNPSLPIDQVSVAGPFFVGALYYFVAAVRESATSNVDNLLFTLDPVAGTITEVSGFSSNIAANSISITAIPVEPRLPDDEIFAPVYFATAVQTPTGFLRIFYAAADFDFNGLRDFFKRGDTLTTPDLILAPPSVVSFGTSGLVTAVKDAAAKEKLIVWESRRNTDDTITPYRIAEHEVGSDGSTSIEACAIPTTHAEADLVSSNLANVGGSPGVLQVRAWRIADRP